MFLRLIIVSVLLTVATSTDSKKYNKEFYPSGAIKAEGWTQNNVKEGFWKFYYEDKSLAKQGHYKDNRKEKYWYFYSPEGKLEKEGRFKNDQKTGWWQFYTSNGKINHKCQLAYDVKNGYCLKYKNEKLSSAEKYENGKKIKEWFSFAGFKKENNLSDLR